MKRRSFLHGVAAALPLPNVMVSAADRPPPSERLTVGVIGLGGMGMGHVRGFLGKKEVQLVAVCDVDRAHHRDGPLEGAPRWGREPAQALVEQRYGDERRSGSYRGCRAESDFRKLCQADDLDAVVVATPDHWHALCALEALRHGKDVYCEKPLTHRFTEGQRLYQEAARRKAIVQTGSQQRSNLRFRMAVEVVLNGWLGKVQKVDVGLPTGPSTPRIEEASPATPPASLDYDFWCGPSPKLPYIRARHHRHWRWHWAYGGGNLMDWIGHHNDIAHWGLGMDASGPERVEAKGWTAPETAIYDTAVDYEIVSTYAGGIVVSLSNQHRGGTRWTGDRGWLHVTRGKIEASEKDWIREAFDRGPIKAAISKDHRQNFLDSIRTRKPCLAPAETGHRSITPGHLGHVSHRLGRALRWDPAKETVLADPEADALLKSIEYRAPWSLA